MFTNPIAWMLGKRYVIVQNCAYFYTEKTLNTKGEFDNIWGFRARFTREQAEDALKYYTNDEVYRYEMRRVL